MKVLNIGSLNIDYVYNVSHIVRPGETLATSDMNIYPGGKGINQSVALAKAGAEVYHAGAMPPTIAQYRCIITSNQFFCRPFISIFNLIYQFVIT